MAVKEGKFSGPIATGRVGLSQTHHGESATNPNDLSQGVAIDILIPTGKPVYAICDGKVRLTTSTLGSYISIVPDGQTTMMVNYVHTVRWKFKKNDQVKRGQIIGYVGKENHLHLETKNISGKAPHPQIMDYFDHNVKFSTPYPSIKALWFKGTEINWSLFKDLTYKKVTVPPVTPPSNVDNCKEELKQLKAQYDIDKSRWDLEKGVINEQHRQAIVELENEFNKAKGDLVSAHLNEIQIKNDLLNAKETDRVRYQKKYIKLLDWTKLSILGKINAIVEDLKDLREMGKNKIPDIS